MPTVPEEEILRRLSADSPWWKDRNDIRWKEAPRRVYFASFFELIEQEKINRAVVLTGSRRVGKTVMVHQAVAELIRKKVEPRRILYVPLDNFLYSGLPLEEILLMFTRLNSITRDESCYLFFDEIQYLGDWERHLKSLVDSYPQHRFTAIGSAAAALRMKSGRSGVGRFTDFILPHLTFYEYFKFSGAGTRFFGQEDIPPDYPGLLTEKIEELNKEFADYINLGGYPETVFSEETGTDPDRFIRNGFVEKVLLRDLPNLYGIRDIRELNRLFAALVYNTGREIDPQGISEVSNAAKGTISRYLEYLEAAFLIKRVSRIDRDAGKFRRERKFKVYPANASMYAALFGALEKGDKAVLGKLAETAVFSHCFHLAQYPEKPYYARWKNGEVALVVMDGMGTKPAAAVGIKWSDGSPENPSEIRGLADFAEKHELSGPGDAICCTLTEFGFRRHGRTKITMFPASLLCFELGRPLGAQEFRETLVEYVTGHGS